MIVSASSKYRYLITTKLIKNNACLEFPIEERKDSFPKMHSTDLSFDEC